MDGYEVLSGCVEGGVRVLTGSNGVKVVCQERHEHNFDLSHENWGEVGRWGETLKSACIMLTGDKAAGKTTFLAGVTSGHPRVLQVCKYDNSSFYNIWYGVGEGEAEELRTSLAGRRMGFFQTELAHGSMVIPAQEYAFFLDDDEYCASEEDRCAAKKIQENLQDTTHVLLRVVELGGDALHYLNAGPPVDKQPIYDTMRKMIEPVGVVCYFLAGGLEEVSEKLRSLRVNFKKCCRLLLFTRVTEILNNHSTVIHAARVNGFPNATLHEASHLEPDGVTFDYSGVLKTLHRMALCCSVGERGLGGEVVGDHIAGLLLKSNVGEVDKKAFMEILEEYAEEVEHGHVYDEAAQPFVALPPAYLLSIFEDAMVYLVSKGFALPPSTTLKAPGVTLTTGPAYTLPTTPMLRDFFTAHLALSLPTPPTLPTLASLYSLHGPHPDLFLTARYLQQRSFTADDGALVTLDWL